MDEHAIYTQYHIIEVGLTCQHGISIPLLGIYVPATQNGESHTYVMLTYSRYSILNQSIGYQLFPLISEQHAKRLFLKLILISISIQPRNSSCTPINLTSNYQYLNSISPESIRNLPSYILLTQFHPLPSRLSQTTPFHLPTHPSIPTFQPLFRYTLYFMLSFPYITISNSVML